MKKEQRDGALPLQSTHISKHAWYSLLLLTVAYSFSWMDRFLLVILVDPIGRDLNISDTQMGLLTGFGAAVLYSLAGFPIARLADRKSRTVIISATLGIWSAATAAMGLARSFASLALMRFGIAASSAGCSPASYSLISDLFPPNRRGTAIAIYSLGISIGTWAGLTLGGTASDTFGWRYAFLLLGLPGILFAFVMAATMREPKRGQFDTDELVRERDYSLPEATAFFMGNRDLSAIALGFGFLTFATASFETWVPTYLIRAHGLSVTEAGSLSGLSQGLMGIVGALCIGILSDRLARNDKRWYLWMPIICGLVSSPLILIFFALPTQWSYVCYFAIEFFIAGYSAPLFVAGQMLLPPRLRALGMAGILFVLNVIGQGAGPSLTGWFSDLIGGSGPSGGLAPAIMVMQGGAIIGVALLLIPTRRRLELQPV